MTDINMGPAQPAHASNATSKANIAHEELINSSTKSKGLLPLRVTVYLCNSRILVYDDLTLKATARWPNSQRVWKWYLTARSSRKSATSTLRNSQNQGVRERTATPKSQKPSLETHILDPRIGGAPQREVPAHRAPRGGDARGVHVPLRALIHPAEQLVQHRRHHHIPVRPHVQLVTQQHDALARPVEGQRLVAPRPRCGGVVHFLLDRVEAAGLDYDGSLPRPAGGNLGSKNAHRAASLSPQRRARSPEASATSAAFIQAVHPL
ncbi:hypothetical protein DL771_006653 [Monosporascus sp. 5C6A]|nr:hypothetical protein DL771_006653 [Monosporascus sp. 5C6A]